jgi:2-polyprenyl-3-methyl-5-hydroxy-6-metoxy-1,4-benzoquinol methylase
MSDELRDQYPVFYRTAAYLQERSPLYRNIDALTKHIPIDLSFAEELCSDAFLVSGKDWKTYFLHLDDLFALNKTFLQEQALLEQNRHYRYSTFADVSEHVFTQGSGVDYLWGLYFSEAFWVTHHRLFQFFLTEFVSALPDRGSALEAPVGSAVFLTQLLAKKPKWSGVGVDLSKSAIDLSTELARAKRQSNRIKLVMSDIETYSPNERFDAIICGEFLEHVEDPVAILKKLTSVLAEGGSLFLTTVAWAAFPDHIFLYHSAQEIRDHIAASGLTIKKEFVQPVFARDAGKEEQREIALNYAAILTR